VDVHDCTRRPNYPGTTRRNTKSIIDRFDTVRTSADRVQTVSSQAGINVKCYFQRSSIVSTYPGRLSNNSRTFLFIRLPRVFRSTASPDGINPRFSSVSNLRSLSAIASTSQSTSRVFSAVGEKRVKVRPAFLTAKRMRNTGQWSLVDASRWLDACARLLKDDDSR